MEKERGIKFFKKDVVLKDANGSEVTMRFASEKQEHLDIYLKMHDMTLNSSFEEVAPPAPAPEPQNTVAPKANSNTAGPDLEGAIHVMSEQISVKMADGVKGYSLNTKASKAMKNAKVEVNAPFYLEEYSNDYPKWFYLLVSYDYCWVNVRVRWENWWPGYDEFVPWFQQFPGNIYSLKLHGFTKPGTCCQTFSSYRVLLKLHYDWITSFNHSRWFTY